MAFFDRTRKEVNPEAKAKLLKLRQLQALGLEAKVARSREKIRQWYEHWKSMVFVSFSGGKDSTVLLHLVREQFPRVPAVFMDTGLELPEVRDFVKTIENVIWLKPKIPFTMVLEKYGYPVVSKEIAKWILDYRAAKAKGNEKTMLRITAIMPQRWQYLFDAPFKISDKCCDALKKDPVGLYEKETGRKPFVGTMASDSMRRMLSWMANGCNLFGAKRPISKPLSVWLDDDVWAYIKSRNIPYSKIYDMGYERTGCAFCMFGMEYDPDRFSRLLKYHPKLYDYCMKQLGFDKVVQWYPRNFCRPVMDFLRKVPE